MRESILQSDFPYFLFTNLVCNITVVIVKESNESQTLDQPKGIHLFQRNGSHNFNAPKSDLSGRSVTFRKPYFIGMESMLEAKCAHVLEKNQ